MSITSSLETVIGKAKKAVVVAGTALMGYMPTSALAQDYITLTETSTPTAQMDSVSVTAPGVWERLATHLRAHKDESAENETLYNAVQECVDGGISDNLAEVTSGEAACYGRIDANPNDKGVSIDLQKGIRGGRTKVINVQNPAAPAGSKDLFPVETLGLESTVYSHSDLKAGFSKPAPVVEGPEPTKTTELKYWALQKDGQTIYVQGPDKPSDLNSSLPSLAGTLLANLVTQAYPADTASVAESRKKILEAQGFDPVEVASYSVTEMPSGLLVARADGGLGLSLKKDCTERLKNIPVCVDSRELLSVTAGTSTQAHSSVTGYGTLKKVDPIKRVSAQGATVEANGGFYHINGTTSGMAGATVLYAIPVEVNGRKMSVGVQGLGFLPGSSSSTTLVGQRDGEIRRQETYQVDDTNTTGGAALLVGRVPLSDYLSITAGAGALVHGSDTNFRLETAVYKRADGSVNDQFSETLPGSSNRNVTPIGRLGGVFFPTDTLGVTLDGYVSGTNGFDGVAGGASVGLVFVPYREAKQ